MRFKRGQKLKHRKHGICHYYSETYRGDAIVELYKDGRLVDTLVVKYEELEVVTEIDAD